MGFLTTVAGSPAAFCGCTSASSSGRGRTTFRVHAAYRPSVAAIETASRQAAALTNFPGEDAPRTGNRIVPPLIDKPERGGYEPLAGHRGFSAEEVATSFLVATRSSCPLVRGSHQMPLEPAAGPGTGKRSRPKHLEVPVGKNL